MASQAASDIERSAGHELAMAQSAASLSGQQAKFNVRSFRKIQPLSLSLRRNICAHHIRIHGVKIERGRSWRALKKRKTTLRRKATQ